MFKKLNLDLGSSQISSNHVRCVRRVSSNPLSCFISYTGEIPRNPLKFAQFPQNAFRSLYTRVPRISSNPPAASKSPQNPNLKANLNHETGGRIRKALLPSQPPTHLSTSSTWFWVHKSSHNTHVDGFPHRREGVRIFGLRVFLVKEREEKVERGIRDPLISRGVGPSPGSRGPPPPSCFLRKVGRERRRRSKPHPNPRRIRPTPTSPPPTLLLLLRACSRPPSPLFCSPPFHHRVGPCGVGPVSAPPSRPSPP